MLLTKIIIAAALPYSILFETLTHASKPHSMEIVNSFSETMSWYPAGSVRSTSDAGNSSDAGSSCSVKSFDGKSWIELEVMPVRKSPHATAIKCKDKEGNLYLCSKVPNFRGKHYVAKFDGVAWKELGGVNSLGANNDICAICCDGKNNIYAGGSFTNSSGEYYIAKFNGRAWVEVKGLNSLGANGPIRNIWCDKSGAVYVVTGSASK